MLKTKYITPDEFKEYFGIDLMEELDDDANPSNKDMAFLKRIEDRMGTFLDACFYRNVDREYPCFTDYQKYHYKRALLEQAIYIFRNGDVSTDSGYDPERGEVVSDKTIQRLSIAPNARQELVLCGLWCRKIQSYGAMSRYDWWLY